MKQRVLSLIMALLGIAAGAQADGLVIGGTKIEDGAWYNTSYGPKCLKAGTIKYDDPTHVTFENVTLNLSAFVGVVNCAVSSDINGLYITLVGENKILAEDISTGLYFSKSTSIKGDGSLSIVAAENAIEAVASAGLIITDAHVKAEGGKFGLKGVQSALTIKGSGILEVYGGTKCVGSFKSFREGTVVTAPEGATFKSSVLSVVDKDGNVIKNEWVTIQHAIEVNEETFPDENFRNWILAQDYGRDGYLTDEEIAAVTDIDVYWKSIKSLKGIELFTALTSLDCTCNQLSTLDLSENTALTVLRCTNNQLIALDVSKNTELTSLYCWDNQLTALDVSNNKALIELACYNNQIRGESMDALVNSLPEVTNGLLYAVSIYVISDNGNLMTKEQVAVATGKGWRVQYPETGGDFSGLIAIDATNFPDEKFRNWILAQDYGIIGYLSDEWIEKVTSINVSGKAIANLQGIEFFTSLTFLNCSNNSLTALDVSQNKSLNTLVCGSNKLTKKLNMSQNTALTYLDCSGNKLTALDVSQNTSLTALTCSGNLIQSLDVSKNTALTELDCSGNKLNTLDVSQNTSLTSLDCYQNSIRGEGMTALVNSLPETIYGALRVCKDETPEGNEINTVQVKIATDKHWQVMMHDGTNWVEYEDPGLPINEENFPDEIFRDWILTQDYGKDGYLTDEEIEEVTSINVSDMAIANLKGIEFFTALCELYCYNTNLTSLDVSQNTDLTVLYCPANQLKTLNITNNSNLTYLNCAENQLNTLNLSQNKALEKLLCGSNQLSTLDLSQNPALEALLCQDNQLTTLDLSKNKEIRAVTCYHNTIRGENMTAFVNSLPRVEEGYIQVCKDETPEGNEINTVQVKIATDKHWQVMMYDGTNWVDYESLKVKGDLNDDEVVNIADVVILSNAVLAGSTDLMYDVNGDNKVDAEDITAIVDIITEE